MIKQLLVNWKTTSAGLTMIASSSIHLIFQVRGGQADENSWTIAVLAILGGIGLIFAGDSNKSATAAEMKDMKTQMAHVPTAINSGDTTMLAKSIDQPENETKPKVIA